MSFIETPRFPNNIAFGATVGPEYATDVVQLKSGWEQRNVGWDQALIRFDIEMPLSQTQHDELDAWFRAMKGQGHGFRVRDPRDYGTTASTGRLGTAANAVGVPAYQLSKLYAAGSLSEYRTIRKPVASPTAAIYRGGVLQTAGGGAGNYAIDTTTGVVTFVADSSSSVTAVTVGATTQVTLSAALSGLIVTGKLYLSGLGGTVGASLNGLAHTVSNISGGGLNIYTLSTNTTGLAYTSGGTGYKYPQPADTLWWIGSFDVPCRFESDFLGMRAVEGVQRWSGPLTMREIRT